jgi:hypothetical protein
METHIKILAWLYILFGIFGILGALIVGLVVAGGGMISGDADAIRITSIVALVVGGLIILFSLPSLIAGTGLLGLNNWARILTIVLGLLNLPGFPTGTALGVYTLYVLLNDESSRLFTAKA